MPAHGPESQSEAPPAKTIAALEAAILHLLDQRTHGITICPSEAAKQVAGSKSEDAWRPLMEPARTAARNLIASGKILITQHGIPIDPATAKGPIRLRLTQSKP